MHAELTAKMAAGAGPLNEGDLRALLDAVQKAPFRRIPLPKDHPSFGRIVDTFTQAPANDEVPALALDLLCALSRDGSNVEACSATLDAAAAALDPFLERHNAPTGHGDDDSIIASLITLLLRVSGHRLSGVEILDAVSGKLMSAIFGMTALLRQWHRYFKQSHLTNAEIFDNPNWRDDAAFVVAATRALYELSTAHTFYLCVGSSPGAAPESATTDRDMVGLDKEYRAYMGHFNKLMTSVPIFDFIAATLDAWFEVIELAQSVEAIHLFPYFRTTLTHVLLLISNMLTATTEFSGQLKHHLAKNTIIIQNVALPFLLFALDRLERKQYDPDTVVEDHLKPLLLVVRVVSLISFKIKMFRPHLRKFPLLGGRLIACEAAWASKLRVEFFALVVRFVVNCELADSTAALLGRFAELAPEERARLGVRLTSRKEALYPVNVCCATYAALRPIFEAARTAPLEVKKAASASRPSGDGASDPPPPVGERVTFHAGGTQPPPRTTNPLSLIGRRGNAHRRSKRRAGGAGRRVSDVAASAAAARNREREERTRRHRKLRAREAKAGAGSRQRLADDDCPASSSDSSDNDESDGGANTTGGCKTASGAAAGGGDEVDSVLMADTAERLQALLLHLVAAVSFQEAVLSVMGLETTQYVVPVSDDCRERVAEARQAHGAAVATATRVEEIAAVPPFDSDSDGSDFGVGVDAEDSDEDAIGAVRPTCEPTSVAPPAPAVVAVAPPPPATAVPPVEVAAAVAAAVPEPIPAEYLGFGGVDLRPWRKAAPYGVPSQYLCALSRQFVTVPVISPSGDVFDQRTITDYLKANKRICPITGNELFPSDLVVDQRLRRELDSVRGNYF